MQGSIHPKVVDTEQELLKPGAVLVLKQVRQGRWCGLYSLHFKPSTQVSLFRPATRTPCLNICVNNVVCIYSATTQCENLVPVRGEGQREVESLPKGFIPPSLPCHRSLARRRARPAMRPARQRAGDSRRPCWRCSSR